MNKEIMTIKDLTEYLSVSTAWIRLQILNKTIPYVKMKGNIRFLKKDVDEYMNKNRRVKP